MELPPENENNDCAEDCLNPNAGVVAEEHPGQLDIEHRQRCGGTCKQQGKKRTLLCRPKLAPRPLLMMLRELWLAHLVAVFDDDIVECADGNDGVVILHASAVGRKIDVRAEDALELLERSLVARRAGGAVHSGDIECSRCHDCSPHLSLARSMGSARHFIAQRACSPGSGSR